MPLALVAIQPPSVESSMLSGSWPQVKPSVTSRSSRCVPVMPACTQARKFSRSIHSMASMWRISTETIMRSSPAGSLSAALTLVPPP